MSGNSAFYYVDGDPLKGKWIDLDDIDSIDEVLEELAEEGFIARDGEGAPQYGGDLLVADTDGDLAPLFYGRYGTFDLDEFIEARDSDVDEEVVVAFITCFDEWSESRCSQTYYGHHNSVEDFAYSEIENCGSLSGVPEPLKFYFDFERYGKDLLISDFCESDGHYFWNW